MFYSVFFTFKLLIGSICGPRWPQKKKNKTKMFYNLCMILLVVVLFMSSIAFFKSFESL